MLKSPVAAPAASAPAPASQAIPKTAHVAMLTSLEHYDIKEFPIPEVGDGDILVKVEGCGVCGTDAHEFKRDPFSLIPVALGHEGTGEIVKMGKNVKKDSAGKDLHLGDKVVTCMIFKDNPDITMFDLNKQNVGGADVYGLLPDDDIHCMWYCVSAPSDRFEDIEENFINDIAALGIPVILVLTKVFSKEAATHLEATIRSLKPKIHSVVQVLAKDSEFVPSFGIKELVEETCELLPASIQNSFVNAQKGSLALKRKKSNLVVKASVATSFGEGFIPIPVADAPLIIATQMAMLAKITTIYGIDIKKNRLETVFASIIGILAATTGGKTAVSSLFKMMPGVGTLVGGMISGGVASLITTALGQSYIQLMELTISGKIDLSELPADQLETMFTDLFSNYLKKFKGLKH